MIRDASALRASVDWLLSLSCSKTRPNKASSDGSKIPASVAFLRIGTRPPNSVYLNAKALTPSPPHHSSIAGVIFRHVKDETVGNCDAGVHPQFRTMSVLISDGATDLGIVRDDGRILQDNPTSVRASLHWRINGGHGVLLPVNPAVNGRWTSNACSTREATFQFANTKMVPKTQSRQPASFVLPSRSAPAAGHGLL